VSEVEQLTWSAAGGIQPQATGVTPLTTTIATVSVRIIVTDETQGRDVALLTLGATATSLEELAVRMAELREQVLGMFKGRDDATD
jgi:hypothetical protein